MENERYKFIRKIGSGGMAEVWKARMHGAAGFQKTVAIKQVLPQFAKDPEFIRRFIAEAKVVAELVHPNIVQVHDFGELDEGVFFLAMEYVAGTDVSSLLSHLRAHDLMLPPEVALYIAVETSKALAHTHEHDPPIIHRDISPQNLLVSFKGEVKVADYGIAKAGAQSTIAGTIKGKIGYLSPEQAAGRPVDCRSDLFSLGVTLYQMLTGLPLFPGKTMPEQYAAVARYDDQVAVIAMESVPEVARGVLTRALRSDPSDRFQTAGEMEEELLRCLDMVNTAPTRQALGSLVREYFSDEYRQDQVDVSAPAIGDEPATVARGLAPTPKLKEAEATFVEPPPASRPIRQWIAMAALFIGFTGILTAAFVWGGGLMPEVPTPTQTIVAESPATPTPMPTVTPMRTELAAATEVVTVTATVVVTATPRPTRVVRRTATPAPTRAQIVRKVPKHSAAFLDGCTEEQLTMVRKQIRGAIREGFPLYNEGKVAECFAVYTVAARNVRASLPATCPGPKAAMQAGLARAAKQGTPRQQAWAMRDAFDGLLNAIQRRKSP